MIDRDKLRATAPENIERVLADVALIPADVAAIQRRCQVGVGGRGALDDAHEIMAECYGMLGRLAIERAKAERQRDAFAALLREARTIVVAVRFASPTKAAMMDSLRARIDAALAERKEEL